MAIEKLALAAVSAVMSGLQAYGSYQAAGAQRAAAQAQVENARRQAEVEATQQAAERARRFEAAQSSQTAFAAARGISLDSFEGIARGDREQYTTDSLVAKANLGSRLYNLQLYGWDAEQSARAKQTSALFTAGRSLFDFGRAVYREIPGGGGTGGTGGGGVGTSDGSSRGYGLRQ